MDGLLFELVQVNTTSSTLALLPLSVSGLNGRPTMDTKVVMKKYRQVPRFLYNYKKVAEIILHLIANTLHSWVFRYLVILDISSVFTEETELH